MTLKGLYAKEGRQNDVRIMGKEKKEGKKTAWLVHKASKKPDQRLRRCDLDQESSTEQAGNFASPLG